jgi:hypothetical protein
LSGVVVGALSMTAAAGASPRTTARPHQQRRPGYIVGTARNECGQPLSTFTVNAYGFDGQPNEFPFGSPPLGGVTGHNGRYALRTRDNTTHKPVNALVDSIEGSAPVTYQGHRYVLPLYPTDGRANFKGHSGPGIIRNFRLKLSGVKPGESQYSHDLVVGVGDPAANSFYGTSMLMFLHLGDVTGQTLTVNFRPLTPRLADGCSARKFSRSLVLPEFGGDSNYIFQDIPLAFYRLTATLRGTTTQTVRLALDGQNVTTPSVPFRPVPTSLFGDGSAGPNVSASLTSSPYGS